ncbi:hypothetical protein GCM10011579_087750 [Streptomyces albiflavescens]|uniref:Uncharacterized protein n=1 Tax=Streptomyces albiflavescens TaxID=1623582 RepID=A0A918DAD1_9ACTN|nr:hypothetical protein [Streptomyces albiflavescens]GGN91160.1 hypothetical protein GCM10011579_087750 [Streptomyces albiflavescens]
MNTYEYPLFPGRPGKEQDALEELLRRVNCNDRREPSREAEEYTRRTRRLAAVTILGAVL